MLTDLYDDIQNVLLQKLNNTDLIMLRHVNKYYHKSVSCYGITNKTTRTLDCYEIVVNGYLEILKWARENGCDWDPYTEKLAKQKWPEIFQ